MRDNNAVGWVLALIFVGIVVIVLFVGALSDSPDKETARLNAQARLDSVKYEHKETMFMLWTTSLAAFMASSQITFLVTIGAVVMAVLVFYLGRNLIDAAIDRMMQ